MPLTGILLFVYIYIVVFDPVEGRVGIALTGSLLLVFICIDIVYPVEGRVGLPLNGCLLMAYQHLPSTGSPTSIHI
jgi:hypothetical protein